MRPTIDELAKAMFRDLFPGDNPDASYPRTKRYMKTLRKWASYITAGCESNTPEPEPDMGNEGGWDGKDAAYKKRQREWENRKKT